MTTEMVAFEAARRVLNGDGATLKKVMSTLAGEVEQDVPATPEAPAAIPMTPELVNALARVHEVFGRVNPTAVRPLTHEENQLLLTENRTLDLVIKALTDRLEHTKTIARNHMHALAVARGLGDGEVDQHGHRLIAGPSKPYKVSVEGTDLAWSLQYGSPKVTLDGNVLEQMLADGEIDRETYLSFTVEKRVFDEDKAMRAIQKSPALLKVLKRMIKRGRPTTSLFVRKNK
jgi:hypothetical protein